MKEGITILLTGLPCSGKTTIANTLKRGYGNCIVLDGDEIRKTINNDLSFIEEDREENLRRVAEIAQMLNKQGLTVICSFVSPTSESRRQFYDIVDNFYLAFIDCPSAVCEERDTKGMYKKARSGEIKGFTGVDAEYIRPLNPDVIVYSDKYSVRQCATSIYFGIREDKRQLTLGV
jgi:adenylyl-sulfate kinase